MMTTQGIRVWDLPTRLFHWLLVLAVVLATVSGQIGGAWIEWHGRAGLFILGLIVFRLIWGVIGSSTARFANFVRGPAAIRAYLKGQWQGIGHNPLGAIAVLALLGLISAQVGSGLFANDDINFQGPLFDLIGKSLSDRARAVHVYLFYVLAGLVGLHLVAITFYTRVRKQNLIKPMLTGWQHAPVIEETRQHIIPTSRPRLHHAGALVFAVLLASIAVYAADGGFLPSAQPVQAAPAPAW